MKVKIRAKKIKLDDDLKDFVSAKIVGLAKYTGDLPWAHIEFMKVGHHRKGDNFCAEIQVKMGKERLMIRQSAPDMYTAFDFALDNIAGQIRKAKRKKLDTSIRESRKWKRSLRVWRPSLPSPGRVWQKIRKR